MALPPELATANVYGTYVNLDGGPTVGYLIFQPSPVILKATASREFIVPTTMQVSLDETGHFTIVLPACDDPDVTPSDWTYQVTEAFGSRRVYSIEVHVANGTDQNIYDLAPVALANGTYYLQGDRGPAGPDVLTTVGKPAADVGDDGDKAFDLAAGVVYVRTGTTWDSGTPMGTSSPTGGSLVRRDANGRVQAADPAAASDGATKGYTDTQDTATLASAKSYADNQDTAAKVAPTFTGPVQVTGNQTVTGSQVVNVDQTVGGKLTVSGQTSLAAATVSGTPTNAADVVNKDYVDTTAGTNGAVANSLMRRDGSGNTSVNALWLNAAMPDASPQWATRKDYVDNADNLRVQIGGDLGGTTIAPQVTSGTHHTHTSAQISDATVNATPSTVVSRDANGDSTFHAAWINTAPTNAAHATRKDYVDAGDHSIAANFQSVTAYTTVLSDAGSVVRMNAATAMTVTLPPNSSVAYPTGTWIEIERTGAGTLTIAPGAGVTINAPDGDKTVRATAGRVRLYKTGTDIWYLSGDNNNATSQAVTNATNSPTASTLAKRDASGGLSLAYLDHSYVATPAVPGSGNGRLYLDSTYHGLAQVASDGSIRYQQTYWGSGTTFPAATFLKAGDTCLRTDIGTNGTVFQYTGNTSLGSAGWIPEGLIVCTSTTRPGGVVYDALQIYESDTKATAQWDGANSKWVWWDSVPQSYTPTWQAGVPVPGTGGQNSGWYLRKGKMITVHTDFAFGTGGTFGTGAYRPKLPTINGSVVVPIENSSGGYGPPNTGYNTQYVGLGVAYSGSTGNQTWMLNIFVDTSSYLKGLITDNGTAGATSEVSATTPTWSGTFAGFGMEATFQYQS